MKTFQNSPDFNPALRNRTHFGYSTTRDIAYRVNKVFGRVLQLWYGRGIDSSHWTIENIQDYNLVAKTCALFYTKSTEGNSYTDTASQAGALKAKAAGMITLFFHFFRRNLAGNAQFAYFQSKTEALLNEIGGVKVVIVDMETLDNVGNTTGNNNFKLFCNNAHAAGYKVGLYTSAYYWAMMGLGAWTNDYVDFYLLAEWKPDNNATPPAGMDPEKLAVQQEGYLDAHAWIAPIPGLVPEMDANLILWPVSALEALTGQQWTPGITPPPDPEPTGELLMQFKAKLTYNIRSGPGTGYPDIGDLAKDTIITALEIQTVSPSSVWVCFEPGKWVAMVHAGVDYLDFHAALPCPEGDDMFTPTHKVVTVETNGEKLRAWPGGSEAVQVYHGDLLMKLNQKRGGQELMAFRQEGITITGWIDPTKIAALAV